MQIDKDIPLPKPRTQTKKMQDTAQRMGVGDSVMFEAENVADSLRRAIVLCGYKAAKRKVGGEGWRVWKLAS